MQYIFNYNKDNLKKQEKPHCLFFVPICFIVHFSCWPNKNFLPFSVLQKQVPRMAWLCPAYMAALPHFPLYIVEKLLRRKGYFLIYILHPSSFAFTTDMNGLRFTNALREIVFYEKIFIYRFYLTLRNFRWVSASNNIINKCISNRRHYAHAKFLRFS